MQKKIIALAIAGLASTAAFAQTNVTVYGVADAYYGNFSAKGTDGLSGIQSGGLSGSRVGFRGTEDLGNGLKAVFEYELAFNLDSNAPNTAAINGAATAGDARGNGLTNTRQSFVGLAGGFGTVVAGRLQTPGYYIGKFDALASAAISPQAILAADQGATIAPSNAGRVNNAAAYISPTFSGFSAVAAYGFGEETVDNTERESVIGLGLNYANGPVAVSYVYHKVGNVGANNVAGAQFNDQKEHMVGASYDFGVVKVLGSYQTMDTTNVQNDKDKIYQLGVVVPVGKGNVHAAYGKAARDAARSDSKSWTVAYTYGLSKRTTAYAGYNSTSNDNLANAGVLTPAAGGKSRGAVVGLRHTF
ncbi:porin [uncultured Azonexus sp.]|uniref:porin n=1 Tax=uncultured Azonexus sp. TaxID=520307 RepID=UPI0026149C63|nr:porin [uncultured Azonexus sp.]